MSRRDAELEPLVRHGSARERFARGGGDALSRFFSTLAASARAHDLGDDSLSLAEELVRALDSDWLSERQTRALALLVLATMVAARQGSTRLPLDRARSGPLGRVIAALIEAGGLDDSASSLLREIEGLAAGGSFVQLIGHAGRDEYRPLVIGDGCVYQQRMWWCERHLIARLGARLADAAPLADEAAIASAVADVRARPALRDARPMALSDEQAAAIARAASRPLTVISGGPGTGKTAVIVSLLRALVRLGIPAAEIALAAPTGKAANRMAGAIREGLDAIADRADGDEALAAAPPEPVTLHRLLGYLPSTGRFRRHEHDPLPARAVIVDEASMIDLALMERLVGAVAPRAALVLLGDADQLPSVDAGAVLRDLLAAGRTGGDFAVELTESFRMDPADPAGRAVLLAARAIDAGDGAALLGRTAGGDRAATGDAPPRLARRRAPAALRYEGAELLEVSGDAALAGFVDAWHERWVRSSPELARLSRHVYRVQDGAFSAEDAARLAALLSFWERGRLLCVTRRHAAGAEAVNRRLHRAALAEATLERAVDFYPGEPLLMRHNDYARGLYNGDQGVVVRVAEDDHETHHFRAVFSRGDGFAALHLDALRAHIELAYAMTVHKSQGSEFDHVALILPDSDLPLLSRELLYTAITRARRSAVIVGSRRLVRTAVGRRVERFSGIGAALAEGLH